MIFAALRRAQGPIVWIWLTYAIAVLAGAAMAHGGSGFALRQRDNLVGGATSTSIGEAMNRGSRLRAALLDFGGNLVMGAVPSTAMGLGIALPFPMAAYRGWIGGIVSVDGRHESRLGTWREGGYYLAVLLLQLIPYSLAGGAGVRLGLANLFPNGRYGYPGSRRWLSLPVEGLRDVGRIYVLVVPLFLAASLFEFLAR